MGYTKRKASSNKKRQPSEKELATITAMLNGDKDDAHFFAKLKRTSVGTNSAGPFGSPDGYTATLNRKGYVLMHLAWSLELDKWNMPLADQGMEIGKLSEDNLVNLIGAIQALV